MRQSIKNYIEAAKQRREDEEEKGFSLIELIVVVVIIGILAAIAIPIFAGIQKNANDAAAQSAAANAATSAAINASKVPAVTQTNFTSELGGANVTSVTVAMTGTDLTTICATALVTGGNYVSWMAGPGCTADHGAAS